MSNLPANNKKYGAPPGPRRENCVTGTCPGLNTGRGPVWGQGRGGEEKKPRPRLLSGAGWGKGPGPGIIRGPGVPVTNPTERQGFVDLTTSGPDCVCSCLPRPDPTILISPFLTSGMFFLILPPVHAAS